MTQMRRRVLSILSLGAPWGSALGGPLRMMGQFARATFGTLGRALRAKEAAFVCTDVCGLSRASSARLLFDRSSREDAVRPSFSAWVQPPVRQALAGTLCYRDGHGLPASIWELGAGEFADLPCGRRLMRNPCVLPSNPHRQCDVVVDGTRKYAPSRSPSTRRDGDLLETLWCPFAMIAREYAFPLPRRTLCAPIREGRWDRDWRAGDASDAGPLPGVGNRCSAVQPARGNYCRRPGRDEIQLFMHSIMVVLLQYGRDSGRHFFASSPERRFYPTGSSRAPPESFAHGAPCSRHQV